MGLLVFCRLILSPHHFHFVESGAQERNNNDASVKDLRFKANLTSAFQDAAEQTGEVCAPGPVLQAFVFYRRAVRRSTGVFQSASVASLSFFVI